MPFLLYFDDMRVLIIEGYEPVRKSVAMGLGEASFVVNAAEDGLSNRTSTELTKGETAGEEEKRVRRQIDAPRFTLLFWRR